MAEDELRAALDRAAHALAIAAVWITEPDRHARIKRAERDALAVLGYELSEPAFDEDRDG